MIHMFIFHNRFASLSFILHIFQKKYLYLILYDYDQPQMYLHFLKAVIFYIGPVHLIGPRSRSGALTIFYCM